MAVRIITADVFDGLRELPDESVHCVVTSPPYFGLRDYGMPGQIGLEPTPDAYVAKLVEVFREVRRVLRKDGTCWLNLGDSYWGSWANYAGGERGAGKQRLIKHGSSAQNPVWDGLEEYRPAASYKHENLKPKDLIGIPWRVAFALQADGWWLRQDIIWSKPNPMPESVTDRCTKAHEYLFMLTKSARYFYDAESIKEAGSAETLLRADRAQVSDARVNGVPGQVPHSLHKKRDKQRGHSRRHDGFNDRWDAMEKAQQCSGLRNKRSVWEISPQPFPDAHFATFPPALIEPCIKAGCPEGGTVLDPFGGSGTTGLVADRLKRNAVLIELNPEYAAMAERRVKGDCPMFAEVSA